METPFPETDLTTLKTIKLLGKGAMGTVFLVHHAPLSDHPFALKVVEKHPPKYKPDTARRVYRELDILARISNLKSHRFLPSLISFSDTNEFWAWAIPYCSGGDLNILRQSQMERTFAPSVIKFYAAEIVCALERLHLMGIVYRDLKPENILIQQSGHITLTDFDLSRTLNPKSIKNLIYSDSEHLLQDSQSQAVPNQTPRESRVNALTRYFSRQKKESSGVVSLKRGKSSRVSPVSRRNPTERSNSFVGTEEYVAPEVIRGEGHEFSVDWWALGILLYEMLYGTTPFKGRNRKETFTNIVTKQVEFTGKQTPLMDLIKKLLDKDPTSRLGFERGALDIKEHSFFDGLRWELLTEVLRPPFIPPRHGEEAAAEEDAAGDVREYFRKVDMGRVPSTPVGSPAREVGGPHVLSLSDF